jgi:hypothetical protein
VAWPTALMRLTSLPSSRRSVKARLEFVPSGPEASSCQTRWPLGRSWAAAGAPWVSCHQTGTPRLSKITTKGDLRSPNAGVFTYHSAWGVPMRAAVQAGKFLGRQRTWCTRPLTFSSKR